MRYWLTKSDGCVLEEGSSCLLTKDDRGIGWAISSWSMEEGCPPPTLSIMEDLVFAANDDV